MNDPTIGIIYARDRHPAAKSLTDLQDPERAALVLCDEHLPLSEALAREWEQDAHFLLYRLDADPSGDEFAFARVSKRSPFLQQLEEAGGRVRIPLLVFDFDLHVDGKKARWTPERFEQHLVALAQPGLPEPTAFYSTLHGSRLIYVLSEEVGPTEAEALTIGMIQRFAALGVQFDEQCSDWTRLFRLPCTVRA